MKRREFMALVPAAMFLAACSSSDGPTGGNPPPPPPPPAPPPPPPAGADVTVNIVDNAFVDPDGNRNDAATVTIDSGQTVGWTHNGAVQHSVTSTSVPNGAQMFDSGTLDPGDDFTVTLDVAGTYLYNCEFHPGEMFDATIIVQ